MYEVLRTLDGLRGAILPTSTRKIQEVRIDLIWARRPGSVLAIWAERLGSRLLRRHGLFSMPSTRGCNCMAHGGR